jgi:hypothetical protein
MSMSSWGAEDELSSSRFAKKRPRPKGDAGGGKVRLNESDCVPHIASLTGLIALVFTWQTNTEYLQPLVVFYYEFGRDSGGWG